MARYTKTIQFIFLSVLLHLALIWALISVQPPASKEKEKKQPIQTYLVFDQPDVDAVPVVSSETALEERKDQKEQSTESSAETNVKQQVAAQIEAQAKSDLAQKSPLPEVTTPDRPAASVKKRVSQYIQQLHVSELENLSERALDDFRQPKPLIDKSKTPTTNQRLRAASESFAPKGADILVLSEFGPGEKTVLLGDACARIVETALDDKVWKGASIWVPTDACGKYDKYDGQLQKSLEKYLNK